MALPQKLVEFTSPIVAKALETGGRGSTVTKTDYGVIGDAMFKKATLDLGIAELKGNLGMEAARIQGTMGMQKAELLSGIEMQKAGLNFEMAKHRMDMNLKLQDMKMQLRENEVGFFEGLFGTLAGAAKGAVAGSIIPGVGTVAGAVAGGAATGIGYATEGRAGGIAAQEMLGVVADGAFLMKGLNEEKKGKAAWDSWSGIAQTLANNMNNPNLSPEQRMQAGMQFDQHFQKGMGVMTNELGANPETAAKTMQDLSAIYQGTSTAGDKKHDFATSTMQRAIQAKADKRFDNPAQARDALKDFLDDTRINYALAHAGKEIPPDLLDSITRDSGVAQRKGVMDMQGMRPKEIAPMSQEQYTPQDSETRIQTPQQPRVKKSKQPTLEHAPPPVYSDRPQQDRGRAWHPPMVRGPGVQMDDGGAPGVAAAEQQLARQGAEAVKALQKDEVQGPVDRILHGGKDKTLGDVPGLISQRGVAQDNKKIEDQKAKDIDPVGGEDETREALQTRSIKGEKLQQKRKEYDVKIRKGVERLHKSGYSAEGSEDLATNVENANSAIDEMMAELDNLPRGQLKGIAADLNEEGVDPSMAAGAFVGSKFGGGKGAAAGAALAPKTGMKVGKGAGLGLNDSERASLDRLAALKNDVVPAFVRTNDPGSAVREFESRGYDNLLPDPRRSPEENRRRLVELKGRLAQRVAGGAKVSERKFELDRQDKSLSQESSRLNIQSKRMSIEDRLEKKKLSHYETLSRGGRY